MKHKFEKEALLIVTTESVGEIRFVSVETLCIH